MQHLQGLNARQSEAVEHTEGPLLIVAGAGAGKTRVITHRILHLIKKGVAPEAILAITFTNKAAKEMKDRVFHFLDQQPTSNHRQQPADSPVVSGRLSVVGSPWIGTFHSLGVHIIRENSKRLGIPQHFAIFDKGDSLSAIKEALKRSDRDPKSFEPAKILSAISREKGKMVALDEFREKARGEYFPEIVADVWTEYQAILKEEKALDFDDLLLQTALLLQTNAAVLEHYQRLWRYIHVDEYQDTNHVQYILTKLLAEHGKNIAVVGDIDQNIYSWRGASIKNILDFEKDYPNAKIVLLEENYRSTQTILAVANRIIEKNKFRREKTLFTKNAEGAKVGLYTSYDEVDEGMFVSLKAKQLIESGVPPREIAVLFRANFQSRVLEEAFLSADVPYQVLGTRFFERKEVKDVIAYVRAALTTFTEHKSSGQILTPLEGMSDIRRIINVPPRGIGKVTIVKIFAGQEAALPSGTKEKLRSFRKLLRELRSKLENGKLSEALKWIVTHSGIEADLKRGGIDDEERLENIKELVTFAKRYDPPAGEAGTAPDRAAAVNRFFTDVALQSDQDEMREEKNAVRLMTVHASKGLEFDYVFITGLEEGLFPHERMNAEHMDEGVLEEERRLFYVAVTRARRKLYLSYAGLRTIFGARTISVPSEFIFDIDEAHLEAEEKLEGMGRTIYLD